MQVSIAPTDRKYLRFLWKSGTSVEAYEFTWLAFGNKASPHLACRDLLETVEKFGQQFDPIVADIVQKSFYVDDMLRSTLDEHQALEARVQIQARLEIDGFKLRKWLSNSSTVMAPIPPHLRGSASKPI